MATPNPPDPADSYERSHPEHEAGMGHVDNNANATPTDEPDLAHKAVPNRQDPSRQINGQDVVDGRATEDPKETERALRQRSTAAAKQPDHSMFDEEPDGWDQAPTDIHDPRQKRHPRHEGRGGTP
jgi:hypothetical protein